MTGERQVVWPAVLRALDRVEARLQSWRKPVFLAVAAATALALSLAFLSPRWSLLLTRTADSYEWYRGLGFLQQCENPWRTDVEPALRARLLLPLLAHFLRLGGDTPFLISWAGVLVLVVQVLRWVETATASRLFALLFTCCLATTSAIMVPLHWLGLNDAWVWLGLLGVVLSRSTLALPAACLLCPWIDERFVLGLPLALWVAARHDPSRRIGRLALNAAVCLAPYLLARVLMHFAGDDGTAARFLSTAFAKIPVAAAWAPLGWWLGLRAAWLLCAYALINAVRARCAVMELAVAAAAFGASTFLAHDFSRSIAILVPWIALGALQLRARTGAHANAILLLLVAANCLLPAAHLVERRVAPILPLPVELVTPRH